MKKKKLLIMATMIGLLGLTGCGDETLLNVNVNMENVAESNNDLLGMDALTEIGNGLYYDAITGIVYWWNGYAYLAYQATTPTPYYSSNGRLCQFNPETNTISEILPIEYKESTQGWLQDIKYTIH